MKQKSQYSIWSDNLTKLSYICVCVCLCLCVFYIEQCVTSVLECLFPIHLELQPAKSVN